MFKGGKGRGREREVVSNMVQAAPRLVHLEQTTRVVASSYCLANVTATMAKGQRSRWCRLPAKSRGEFSSGRDLRN